jgi:ATP-dependent helicase/nuclease subunit A
MRPSEGLLRDIDRALPVVRELFSLVSDFGRRYEEEKKNRGVIDFSDQEHMALSL